MSLCSGGPIADYCVACQMRNGAMSVRKRLFYADRFVHETRPATNRFWQHGYDYFTTQSDSMKPSPLRTINLNQDYWRGR